MHDLFAAQSVGISIALVHTECDYFQMYELVLNKDMHVCQLGRQSLLALHLRPNQGLSLKQIWGVLLMATKWKNN